MNVKLLVCEVPVTMGQQPSASSIELSHRPAIGIVVGEMYIERACAMDWDREEGSWAERERKREWLASRETCKG